MEKVLEWLKGKKSYFIAAGIGIVVALQAAGVIDASLGTVLLGFLGAGGVATIAAKVDRNGSA